MINGTKNIIPFKEKCNFEISETPLPIQKIYASHNVSLQIMQLLYTNFFYTTYILKVICDKLTWTVYITDQYYKS